MKNTSKKRGVWDSIYAVLDYIFRIVMINLLIIIPAFFPVVIYSWVTNGNENPSDLIMYITLLPAMVYIFPAITAGVDVFKMYQEKITKGVFKEFFISLKKHFLKSLVVSILVVVFFIILTFRMTLPSGVTIYGPIIYFFNNLDNLVCFIGLGLTISFILFGIFILIHLPLVMVYFDGLTLWQYLKLAFIMAFKKIGLTLVILLIVVAFVMLNLSFNIVTFICGVSLPLYLLVKLSFKDYIKIYRKVERKENEG